MCDLLFRKITGKICGGLVASMCAFVQSWIKFPAAEQCALSVTMQN